MTEDGPSLEGVDLDRANVARMYDYLLGGAHNFAVDRELADRVIAADASAVPGAHQLRSFLRRVVELCLDRGIDQFLDLGSGIPTIGNVHEVARRRVPHARVAYVDNEPVAVHHSREIVKELDGVAILQADLRDYDTVLSAPSVRELIDFDRPVAVLMLAVLHFLPEDLGPTVAAYRRALVPGSALALSHASLDWDDRDLAESMRRRGDVYRSSAQPPTMRDRPALRALFSGLDMAEPGLVDIAVWRPDAAAPAAWTGAYGAVGFVPAAEP